MLHKSVPPGPTHPSTRWKLSCFSISSRCFRVNSTLASRLNLCTTIKIACPLMKRHAPYTSPLKARPHKEPTPTVKKFDTLQQWGTPDLQPIKQENQHNVRLQVYTCSKFEFWVNYTMLVHMCIASRLQPVLCQARHCQSTFQIRIHRSQIWGSNIGITNFTKNLISLWLAGLKTMQTGSQHGQHQTAIFKPQTARHQGFDWFQFFLRLFSLRKHFLDSVLNG